MNKRVLVVSSANMDFVQRVTRLPKPGQTITENAGYSYIPGGKGSNSAVAFARIGSDTVLCAKVGRDTNGAALKRLYTESGIDTRFVTEDAMLPTGLASVIVETETGENRIIVYPGSNGTLMPDDVEDALTCYPDGVYSQLEIPAETVVAAAGLANAQNIPFFLDAGPVMKDFPLEEIEKIEILSPNETEAEALTGIRPDTIDNCLRACVRLSSRVPCSYVVLKLGHRGSFIYDGKYYHLMPACRVKAVDTTAAGDVFTAVLTYAYLAGKSILDAAKMATYAASLSVTREGAIPSIPTLREVKEFKKTLE